MTNVEVLLNGEYHRFNATFYKSDTVTIDMELDANESVNSILLFVKEPRSNIKSVIYASNISFDAEINETTFGSLTTASILNYTDYHSILIPLDIITRGTNIIGITIFFPSDDKRFLRELKLTQNSKYEKEVKECPICFETKETLYIDSFHSFCIDCILSIRGPDLCPICRQPFL
jgi:hypothetical protein